MGILRSSAEEGSVLQGSRFRVLGFRVEGSGFRGGFAGFWGLGQQTEGFGVWIDALMLRVPPACSSMGVRNRRSSGPPGQNEPNNCVHIPIRQ